jgi:hypothetical protein
MYASAILSIEFEPTKVAGARIASFDFNSTTPSDCGFSAASQPFSLCIGSAQFDTEKPLMNLGSG